MSQKVYEGDSWKRADDGKEFVASRAFQQSKANQDYRGIIAVGKVE